MSDSSLAVRCWPLLRWMRGYGSPSADDQRSVERIRETAVHWRGQTDSGLQERMRELRAALRSHRCLSAQRALVESTFALVHESVRRCLGLEYYDVQLLAGLALVRGHIAELATGEGKTLVQALAATAFALPSKGVHVMTSNAYLAERDYQQLEPVYQRLGLRAGLLRSRAEHREKQLAYAADVTYGPGYEFGFDFLRDQLSRQCSTMTLGTSYRQHLRGQPALEQVLMQRGHAAAIVDEADSVFIDEATLPLVLATDPSTQHSRAELYRRAAAVAAGLRETNDFVLDQPNRRARLTQVGLSKVMDAPALPPPEWLDRSWPACMEQALVAEHLLCRDVDYVVDRGQLMLVDQFTGRIFADRTLRHGLHQAVQAKENLAVTAEPQAQARISRQRFLRLYKTLCGMTGTALGSEREFREVFRLPVTVVPPRVACRRAVLPARFFSDKHSKRLAIKDEVRRCHAAGQPVLIGTRTIVESRCLAELFREGSLPFALLDGTQDAAEASLVARAGQLGAITLATNVAGRGTDIRLGPGAAERGGLHVIVSEPHAARRIDWQLLGRAARQGDPGSTRMFASADDDLIRLHASQLARRMRAWADPSGEIHRDLSAAIERVQRGVESVHRQHRRRMLRFDAWLEEFMNTLHGGGPDA